MQPAIDRGRHTIGLLLAPLVFLGVLAAPTGLEPAAHRLAAVFALVVVLWVTEALPLPVTALVGPALAVVLGVAPPAEAFRGFGHPVIFLFLGSFLISGAMVAHGLDRRIALFVLSRAWVGERPARVLLAFGGISAVLSMWMSNTATTAMMLPIGLGVLRTLHPGTAGARTTGPASYGTGLMLMIAFSCNIGGMATPVGSPPNLIALGMLEQLQGRRLSFLEWMGFGVPIAIACFALLYLVMRLRFLRGPVELTGAAESIRRQRAELPPWTAGERAALASFLLAVALWTLPGMLDLALGSTESGTIAAALPESVAALLAATILFLWPVDWPERRFALEWQEAVRIDWGTILLFGGGLSLGTLAFHSGLAAALGRGIETAAHALPFWLVVIAAVLVADAMTEFMSNTATANLLVPIFLALSAQAALPSTLPAIGATLGCSLAFCLPVATPPNAIVYGSGHVKITQMVQSGLVLDVGCGLLTGAGLLLLRTWVSP